ncbi:MAG TPA: peptidylprolyl isomerase [Bacteroidia bacterium]|nr:peptidylprolyl isomerase [Bacteroidia bacterium]HNS11788.1 peptidylprolyl isomerase [Bacteroidia bacterium]
MAVIGKIRKRVGLLIGFIGVSLLAFILGDIFSSGTGILGGNSDVVGEVAGEKVHYSEFEKRVETLTENYRINTQTENVDQNTQDMLREQAWGMFLNENTLGDEYKKIGISVSAEELYLMCTGPNPHAQVKQAFSDPKTGQFDGAAVVKFLKDLPNRDEATQRQWRQFEDAIREERIASKYKDMIKSGLFATTAEAKEAYTDGQKNAAITYFRLDYNTIPDSAVVIEESDLKAYHSANAVKYKQTEDIRKIEYVAFEITPSAEDRQEVTEWVNKKFEEFSQSTNDVSFVNQYSDNQFDSTFHAKGSLAPVLDSVMFSASPGKIVGPYMDGETYKISKLVADRFVPDSVKARHILISIENGDTAKARNTADSLKSAIKRGAKFADLAVTFSKDPGSGSKGGDLGWFRQGAMVQPFNDACFEGNKGDMPIVTSQFGVHLIEITDKGVPSKQVQIATLERKVEPSQKTYDDIYAKANQFASVNNTVELFDSACIKQGLNKRIADNIRQTDKNIPGLESPRELVRWVYEANTGDISKAFSLGEKYVIAKLVQIKNKGTLPLDIVREQVTAEVRKNKKAEKMIEKIEAAGATTIDALAQKMNTTTTDVEAINFQNPYVQGLGNEPKVVGTIFGMKQGTMSKPIQSESGVIVLYVKSISEPAAITDYSTNIKQIVDQRRSRSEYEVFNALKEKANVEDNRGKFY